jgi:tRNA pseudouridine38-40 synthase
MNNYMAVIEYDGTDFNGFQIQPEGTRTVQGELISVLSTVFNTRASICYAGRTDAGVHAKGQVINFKTGKELDLFRFKWSINSMLPDDIAVRYIKKVEDSFDSRRDAREREYSYNVVNTDYHSVFLKKYSILITGKMDLGSVRKAAKLFEGEHDFAPFSSQSIRGSYTIRKIFGFSINIGDGGLIEFTIRANSFLYNMVRIIIGTILEVGKGERGIREVKEALFTGQGDFTSSLAPAKGLFLTRVDY